MTPETHPLAAELLSEAGRLLLENNESAAQIDHALAATAKRLSPDACRIVISYERVGVSFGHGPPMVARVRELHFNAALQARVHALLARLQRGELGVDDAIVQLARLKIDAPRHSPWLVAILLGCAAASLARLLGADRNAMLVAAIAAGVGFLVRRELARRRFSAVASPFVAALIGAVLGGLAIRRGWTSTPALALIVPSLILVPGPHLITGLLDVVDNYVPLGISRLALAAALLVAAALGITVGIELTLGEIPEVQAPNAHSLSVISDMLMAAIVTCGFALAYNTQWSRVLLAMFGGMVGHGLRFLALQWGCTLSTSTFLGGLAVGNASALIATFTKSPFAVIAFAGAVTMMPGVQIYRALGGAIQLAHMSPPNDAPPLELIAGHAAQACVVTGALALGLLVGQRVIALLAARGASAK